MSTYNPTATLKRTTQETVNKVIELYLQGYSQNYIESSLSMTRKTIRTILKEEGILRTKQEQTKFIHVTSTLREDAFDVLDDSAAYWLGFLYADGYITNPETTTAVGILLKAEDAPHLEKLRDFLKAPQKIMYGSTSLNDKEFGHAKLKIGSQRLHARLRELGFTHNKSYDACPPEFLKYNRHFWRGVIDGDGHIGLHNNPTISLCGTEATIKGFKEFVLQSGIKVERKILQQKTNLFVFEISSEKAKKVAKLLYENAQDYLDRKYKIYTEFPECINYYKKAA